MIYFYHFLLEDTDLFLGVGYEHKYPNIYEKMRIRSKMTEVDVKNTTSVW